MPPPRFGILVPMTRIERVTSPLPRECSTTEPHGPNHCSGAGEGNRTLVVSLEGFCSAIELHPPAATEAILYFAANQSTAPWLQRWPDPPGPKPAQAWWRGLDSNQRRRKPTDLQSAPFSHSGTPPQGTTNYGCQAQPCQTGRQPQPRGPACVPVPELDAKGRQTTANKPAEGGDPRHPADRAGREPRVIHEGAGSDAALHYICLNRWV